MGRNLAVACSAVLLLASACGVRNSALSTRSCVPSRLPLAFALPATALHAGLNAGAAGISISPDGRLLPEREQPAELAGALAGCTGDIGGAWSGDCARFRYDYAAPARGGFCSLVSQTDADEQHNRVRAILVPPLPAGQAALDVFDSQTQVIIFQQMGNRWAVISQERAFLD